MQYNPNFIEKKWQNYWRENHTFKTLNDKRKPKFYVLDMFPYPSGKGLHVGHVKGYTATDIIARVKRSQGFNVLHPMGWDAFGLPAEQYALETGNDPEKFTKKNIEHFRFQINSLGFSFDWNHEINTTDPNYYKWTQWIFTKLFEKGLAYESEVAVNWVPELGTVISKEEVVNGKSERGGYDVIRKPMRQWMLKITAYADRLLNDLQDLDWPENIKEMQRNWIGRSVGTSIVFKLENLNKNLNIFTTRPDALFSVSYILLAPELKIVDTITTIEQKDIVKAYIQKTLRKSELYRTSLLKEKTGVFTGAYAINPLTEQRIPIWISENILPSDKNGVFMGIPAYEKKDKDFAKKFGITVISSYKNFKKKDLSSISNRLFKKFEFLEKLPVKESIKKMNAFLEKHHIGEKIVTYNLRDWVFSRQRYWGEPIPIIHWEDGKVTVLSTKDLPLLLPKTDNIYPSQNGESPLINIDKWVNVTDPKTGKKGYRETNTMPQWAGSSWYFLRFIDPHNENEFANYEKLEEWLPVDTYIGGAEHAVLHLLYARFWHKFLYDLGLVPTKEPFQKLYNQGMILGKNNEKMSKSRGNVVDPADIIDEYGADTLRLYLMFMGPLDASISWNKNRGLKSSYKFLSRVWRLIVDEKGNMNSNIKNIKNSSLSKIYNQTVKKVTADYERLHFNTVVSHLMIFVNEAYKTDILPLVYIEGFIKLLAPITPHLCEEIWLIIGNKNKQGLSYAEWPKYEESFLEEDNIELIVQVNGKLRTRIIIPNNISKTELEFLVLQNKIVKKQLLGKKILKVIIVPKKLVNLVVR